MSIEIKEEKLELLGLVGERWAELNAAKYSLDKNARQQLWQEVWNLCRARGHRWTEDPNRDAKWLSGYCWPKIVDNFKQKMKRWANGSCGTNTRLTDIDLAVMGVLGRGEVVDGGVDAQDYPVENVCDTNSAPAATNDQDNMCSHRLAIAKLVLEYKDPLFSHSSQISRQNKQELWEHIRQRAVNQHGAIQYARKSWKEIRDCVWAPIRRDTMAKMNKARMIGEDSVMFTEIDRIVMEIMGPFGQGGGGDGMDESRSDGDGGGGAIMGVAGHHLRQSADSVLDFASLGGAHSGSGGLDLLGGPHSHGGGTSASFHMDVKPSPSVVGPTLNQMLEMFRDGGGGQQSSSTMAGSSSSAHGQQHPQQQRQQLQQHVQQQQSGEKGLDVEHDDEEEDNDDEDDGDNASGHGNGSSEWSMQAPTRISQQPTTATTTSSTANSMPAVPQQRQNNGNGMPTGMGGMLGNNGRRLSSALMSNGNSQQLYLAQHGNGSHHHQHIIVQNPRKRKADDAHPASGSSSSRPRLLTASPFLLPSSNNNNDLDLAIKEAKLEQIQLQNQLLQEQIEEKRLQNRLLHLDVLARERREVEVDVTENNLE